MKKITFLFRNEDPSLNRLASESGSQKFLPCFPCIGSKNFICVQIWMKDVECAEPKEKSYFRFFTSFIFRFVVIFVLKTVNFRWIFAMTRKIKFEKLIFLSIQHIAHLSWKWEQKWGGLGSLHILTWYRAKTEIRLYFATFRLIWNSKRTRIRLLFEINQKMVNTIWFQFDLIGLRKDLPT